MSFTITDVDEVIERTGCTYKEAKQALSEAGGDVIDAIIALENKQKAGVDNFFAEADRTAESILDSIKEAIRKGDVTKIEVRDNEGKVLTSVSVNVGAAVGAFALIVGAAPLVAIGALIGRFGLDYRYVIVKEDGSETVI